jgi:hypothetical protein
VVWPCRERVEWMVFSPLAPAKRLDQFEGEPPTDLKSRVLLLRIFSLVDLSCSLRR